MEPFATLKTKEGFPMPDLPKETHSVQHPPDCQETDVDRCVKNIILQHDWTRKVYSEDSIKDWSNQYWSRSDKDKGVLRYAVDECRWHQQQWQHRVGTPVIYCKTGLVLSKDGICQDLRSSVMQDLLALREEQESSTSTMAFHPEYKKICHLVHPSMYAYEKGVTHVLGNAGAETVSSPPWESFLGISGIANGDKPLKQHADGLRDPRRDYGNPYSRREVEPPTAAECSNFQWLPSEFFVSSSDADATGKVACSINSYINNLHPIKYKDLYMKIGELFAETLPLMEEVLSEVNDNGKVRKLKPRFESKVRERVYWRPWMRHDKPKEKKVMEPPIPNFSPPNYTSKKEAVNLKDRPLQVIVKFLSTELKPKPDTKEKPDFDSMTSEQLDDYLNREPPHYFNGGHWHVEGTRDERIVASACCYLESDNVEEEGLHFRDGSVDSLGEELGTVETFPGRIVVWPNYFHHKAGSVFLKDKTRPGHRTLCCFHLVDPTLRVRSTATVPPQQRAWLITDVVDVTLKALLPDGLVRSKIKESMVQDGSTITYEEALNRRECLSEERSGDSHVIAENFWTPCD